MTKSYDLRDLIINWLKNNYDQFPLSTDLADYMNPVDGCDWSNWQLLDYNREQSCYLFKPINCILDSNYGIFIMLSENALVGMAIVPISYIAVKTEFGDWTLYYEWTLPMTRQEMLDYGLRVVTTEYDLKS